MNPSSRGRKAAEALSRRADREAKDAAIRRMHRARRAFLDALEGEESPATRNAASVYRARLADAVAHGYTTTPGDRTIFLEAALEGTDEAAE